MRRSKSGRFNSSCISKPKLEAKDHDDHIPTSIKKSTQNDPVPAAGPQLISICKIGNNKGQNPTTTDDPKTRAKTLEWVPPRPIRVRIRGTENPDCSTENFIQEESGSSKLNTTTTVNSGFESPSRQGRSAHLFDPHCAYANPARNYKIEAGPSSPVKPSARIVKPNSIRTLLPQSSSVKLEVEPKTDDEKLGGSEISETDEDDEEFDDVDMDTEEDLDEELCPNCEGIRLDKALQELQTIEVGYHELLDKLTRNGSELKLRGQKHENTRMELKLNEHKVLLGIAALNLRIVKLRNQKGKLRRKLRLKTVSSKDLTAGTKHVSKNRSYQLIASISKPKMKKILSLMRTDLKMRQKRMAILEECFGAGKGLESETKVQLGYLPACLKYFPERKAMTFLQFNVHTDTDKLTSEDKLSRLQRVDSAEAFERIIAAAGPNKKMTQFEVESLFKSSNSDRESSTDEEVFNPSQLVGGEEDSMDSDSAMSLHSPQTPSTPSPPRSTPKEHKLTRTSYLFVNPGAGGADNPSVSTMNVMNSVPNNDDDVDDDYIDVDDADDSRSDVLASSSHKFPIIEEVPFDTFPDVEADTKRETYRKKSAISSVLTFPTKTPVHRISLQRLAKSIMNFNSNHALRQFKKEKCSKSESNLPSKESDIDNTGRLRASIESLQSLSNGELEKFLSPSITAVENAPSYLIRSSLSTSSLDDIRDYSKEDFPAQGMNPAKRIVLKPKRSSFKTKKGTHTSVVVPLLKRKSNHLGKQNKSKIPTKTSQKKKLVKKQPPTEASMQTPRVKSKTLTEVQHLQLVLDSKKAMSRAITYSKGIPKLLKKKRGEKPDIDFVDLIIAVEETTKFVPYERKKPKGSHRVDISTLIVGSREKERVVSKDNANIVDTSTANANHVKSSEREQTKSSAPVTVVNKDPIPSRFIHSKLLNDPITFMLKKIPEPVKPVERKKPLFGNPNPVVRSDPSSRRPVAVKEMPPYLRFGRFGFRGRTGGKTNPEPRLRGSAIFKERPIIEKTDIINFNKIIGGKY